MRYRQGVKCQESWERLNALSSIFTLPILIIPLWENAHQHGHVFCMCLDVVSVIFYFGKIPECFLAKAARWFHEGSHPVDARLEDVFRKTWAPRKTKQKKKQLSKKKRKKKKDVFLLLCLHNCTINGFSIVSGLIFAQSCAQSLSNKFLWINPRSYLKPFRQLPV